MLLEIEKYLIMITESFYHKCEIIIINVYVLSHSFKKYTKQKLTELKLEINSQ